MPSRSTTVHAVSLLYQLYKQNQITLAPEFQRNSVWPASAKAFLVDSIIRNKPIPILFFQRTVSPQTGRFSYAVIDGQQRLRAIFDYLEDRFPLSLPSAEGEKKESYFNKRFSGLESDLKDRILNYDFVVAELTGYDQVDIQDLFVRMNRYVVKLSPQELRHARSKGAFKDFVERLATWPFWTQNRVFTDLQIRRMRAVEFVAELAILLIEGPQDKKSAIDLYYGQYKVTFGVGGSIESRLRSLLGWIEKTLPNLSDTRYRKPTDLYSLIGALKQLADNGFNSNRIAGQRAAAVLIEFDKRTKASQSSGDVAKYVVAASRQTDNLIPRTTRIGVLAKLLQSA
jgi:Protein of unknown function DUF262